MSIDPLLTLAQAAGRLQWSVRTLKRKLAARGIGTIGKARLARLSEADLARLIEAERQVVGQVAPASPPSTLVNWDARMRSYWRRRNGQLNRKKRAPE
jgi:hypothetical protein